VVASGATVQIQLNVTTDGSWDNNDWKSTKYQIEGGSETCVDHGDHTSSGAYTESFGVTAPAVNGVYDLTLKAYKNDGCSSGVSNTLTLTDAVTVTDLNLPFSDNFGASDKSNVGNWSEKNPAEITSGSGDDTPTDGKFAKIGNDGWACRIINASGDYFLQLKYHWKGDADAENNDDGVVEYKTSGSCGDGSGWSNIANNQLDDTSWNQKTHNLPAALNNTTFKIRFRTAASQSDEYFRVDNVEVSGIPAPSWPTSWTTPSCSTDPAGDESPSEIDLIGDASNAAVGYAVDSNYRYFRERLNGDPGTFNQKAWVVLLQTSAPQYQYLGSLNGKDDKVQLWQNTSPSGSLTFNSILNDPAETKIWEGDSFLYARRVSIGGGKYFVDWAIPLSAFAGTGIDDSTTKFFATSADANNFNKDYLNCYEQPTQVCGNQIIEQPEVCDGNSQQCTIQDGYAGGQACNQTCDGWEECLSQDYCGDGSVNGPEVCDDGANNGGYGYCNSDCSGLGDHCGDGVKNGQEECDGTGGVTPGQNFCTQNCTLVPIYDGQYSCPQGTVKAESPSISTQISAVDPLGQLVYVTLGEKYLIEASGTFVPTSPAGWFADAGYTTNNSWSSLATQYGIQGTGDDYAAHALLSDFGTGVIGVVDWGEFNPDHIYTKYFEPTSDQVRFLIGDRYGDWFNTSWQNQAGMNDNSGSLNLDIYECEQPYANISVTKSDDADPVPLGSIITYTINWELSSNVAVESVKITESFETDPSPQLVDKEWVKDNNPGWTKHNESDEIYYHYLGDFGPGEHSGTVEFRVKVVDTKPYDVTLPADIKNNVNIRGFPTVGEYLISDSHEEHTTVRAPVTIKAYKIVCDSEADLPNWSGTSDITQAKIDSFMSSHSDVCHYEADWDFQWGFADKAGTQGVDKLIGTHIGLADGTSSSCSSNCGPNTNTGAGYNDWKTFGPTNSGGLVQVEITNLEGAPGIWVRENLKPDYVPFTYPPKGGTEDNVSAEIYCHNDRYKYDNYDLVDNPQYGSTYYCVAFNALNKGTIIVEKQTLPDGHNQTFEFSGEVSGWLGDGQQLSAEVIVGTHTVKEETPFTSGYRLIDISCDDSDSSGDVQTGEATFKVDPGETVKCTFTNEIFGSIIAHKYSDLNSNGSQEPGEPDLSGWEMSLYKGNDCLGQLLGKQNTGASGEVSFYSIVPGELYSVGETLKVGWNNVSPLCQNISISPGEQKRVEFANVQFGSIDGHKYVDVDGNGNQETGEPMLTHADISGGVRIFIDNNNDGIFDSGETNNFTGNDGYFLFEQLLAGTYDICEEVPAGWTNTSWSNLPERSNCQRITIKAGENVSHDFGNFQNGQIKACKYEDLQGGCGQLDAGCLTNIEDGIAGVTLKLQKEGDGWADVGDPVQTETDGCYTFVNLGPGNYRVVEDLTSEVLEGYTPTDSFSTEENYRVTDEMVMTSNTSFERNFFNEAPAGLVLAKTNDKTGGASGGDTVTYTLTVTNDKRKLVNGMVMDIMPFGFTFVAGSGKITGAAVTPVILGPMLLWSLGDLDSQEVNTIEYQATVPSGASGCTYTNIAFASGKKIGSSSTVGSNLANSKVPLGRALSYSTGVGGTVLGASTEGQVLGAVLPAAGSDTEYLILALVFIISGIVIRKLARKETYDKNN